MPPIEPTFLGQLYRQHAPALRLYARQWGGSAEDLVQNAFVRLARQTPPPEHVLPWLYRVVRNAALDAGKAERRRQRRESAVARSARWFVEPSVEGLDAEAAVAALAKLGADEREVIVARLWGGLSFEEIAGVAGCSASTAFRRFTAGIDALRKELGES